MALALGGLLFAIGAPLGIVNFIAIGFGATLVNAAIGVGLNLLAGRLLAGRSPELKPSDLQSPIRQAVPPRIRSYGRVCIAGAVFWRDAIASTHILYLGFLLNHGRIGGFSRYIIDNNTVAIDGSGVVTTAPYSGVATTILTRLGLATETAYSQLSSAFGYTNVRGDGVASALFLHTNFGDVSTQTQDYPNGIPQDKVVIDASVVWDWRDTAQSRTDSTTWQTSSNPVVCALDYLMHADGFAIAWEKITANIAQWTAAADACDELLGEETRYSLSFTYDYTQRPGDVLAQILRSCDGKVWPRTDGTMGISVGAFVQPSVTIRSRDVVGYRISYGQDRLASIAGVRAQFKSVGLGYVETDAEPWPDVDTVLALSEDRVVNLTLTMVPSEAQARRLMELEYLRQTSPRRLTLTTTLGGMKALDERWVHVSLPERSIDIDGEVLDTTIDLENGRVTLEIAERVAPAPSPELDLTVFRLVGRGSFVSAADNPTFNYNTVISGEAPIAGDLVVWALVSELNPTYTTPAGWTAIRAVFGGSREQALIAKIVTASDLASALNPISAGGNEGLVALWVAYRNPGATLASTTYSDVTPDAGDPMAVTVDLTSQTGPFLALSMHYAETGSADAMPSPRWGSIAPDAQASISLQLSVGYYQNLTLIWKAYAAAEIGETIRADMIAEGQHTYQVIGEVHFT